MDLEIRPIGDDELRAFVRTEARAFGGQATDQLVEDVRLAAELDRTLAVFDGQEIVGTAGAMTFQLTLPGGATAPAAGVTAVTVRPTHRRRGILTSMMDRQLDDVAARGEPLALLTASETVIYGRYGYGLGTSMAFWRIGTEATVLSSPPRDDGRLRVVEADEAAVLLPQVFERARLRRPGQVSRPAGWWAQRLADRDENREGMSAYFFVVHESTAGVADGYAAYRVRETWTHGLPDFAVWVWQLDAVDDDIEAVLWQHLLDIDLVRTVEGHGRPVDEVLRWRLADPRRMVVTDLHDHLWVRVLDVPVALAARTYGVEGGLVLGVTDRFRPANDGRYRLEGGPDGATCRRTDAEPDLELGAPELGALYLGGVPPTVLAAAGRLVARTPDALRRADALFASSPAPWCATDF